MGNMERIPPQQVVHGISINADLTTGPYYIDGCDTLVKLFLQRCKHLGDRTAHREKDYGIWLSYSWWDFYEHAMLIGHGLAALGLRRGDVVSILSEDNKEWVYTDLAVQCLGGHHLRCLHDRLGQAACLSGQRFRQPVSVSRK